MNAVAQILPERCAIDRALDKQRLDLEERFDKWHQCAADLRPMVREFEKFATSIGLNSELNINVSGDKGALHRSFKLLRKFGFTPSSAAARPKTGDTTWGCYWRKPDCKFNVWFFFCSTTCRRVQVGTKLQEVPVYETQCDSGEMPDPQAELPAPAGELEEIPL